MSVAAVLAALIACALVAVISAFALVVGVLPILALVIASAMAIVDAIVRRWRRRETKCVRVTHMYESLAKQAYDAYALATPGVDRPCWALLDRDEQRAWCAVVRTIAAEVADDEDFEL